MDPMNTPLQKAFDSKSHFFPLMKERGILPSFDTFMTVQKQGRPNFADFFPVKSQLIDGFKAAEDAVMLVDVGGGRGQEILELRQKVPDLPGRTILQETPELVGSLPETPGMEIMEHDFFKPQPIRGTSLNFGDRLDTSRVSLCYIYGSCKVLSGWSFFEGYGTDEQLNMI